MAKLPDPTKKSIVAQDTTKLKANVEISGLEVHKAFVGRVNELRAKREEAEKQK